MSSLTAAALVAACLGLSTTVSAQSLDTEQLALRGINAYSEQAHHLAARDFEVAGRRGNRLAQYNLAIMLARGEASSDEAYPVWRWLRRASLQGLPQAQYAFALLYANGDGVERNAQIAAQWYRKAAVQGHLGAQLALAHMYLNAGTPGDARHAAHWFKAAALAGDRNAQRQLAHMLENGEGVPRDPDAARLWLQRADPSAPAQAR